MLWVKRILAIVSITAVVGAALSTPSFADGRGDPLLGDVNGDGHTDRATLVGFDGGRCGVDVELGEPGGGFGAPTRYSWDDQGEWGYCPDMGVIVDLGGDGEAELVLAYFDGRPDGIDSDLVVLEDFTPAGGFDAIWQPSYLGLENFNTDNLVDVYEWTDQGDGLVTFLNTPSGQLVPGPIHLSALDFTFEFGDFDRNGATDVVAGFTGAFPAVPDTGVVVILDNGERVFLESDPEDSYSWDVDVLKADADTKLDVRTVSHDTGEVTHYINDGDGHFTAAPTAVDDTVQVPYLGQKTISVLVNDAATTAATLQIVTPPTHGTIVKTNSKGFVYKNTVKQNDTFVYRLTVDGKTDTATVHLRVK